MSQPSAGGEGGPGRGFCSLHCDALRCAALCNALHPTTSTSSRRMARPWCAASFRVHESTGTCLAGETASVRVSSAPTDHFVSGCAVTPVIVLSELPCAWHTSYIAVPCQYVPGLTVSSLVQIRLGSFLPGPRQACRTAAHYNHRYLTKLAPLPPPSIGPWPRISCQVPAPTPLPVAILTYRHHLQRSWSGAGGSLLRQGALDRYPP
ncbi:hypothetical protein BKA80DRAFT_262640 [Phyllosticta citrichinensis]